MTHAIHCRFDQQGSRSHLFLFYIFFLQAVLKLLLDLGRVGCLNASPTFEEDIIKFFNPCHQGEGATLAS